MAAILALARRLASVDEPAKLSQPLVFLGGCVRAEPGLDGRQQLRLKSGQFAQRGNLIDARESR